MPPVAGQRHRQQQSHIKLTITNVRFDAPSAGQRAPAGERSLGAGSHGAVVRAHISPAVRFTLNGKVRSIMSNRSPLRNAKSPTLPKRFHKSWHAGCRILGMLVVRPAPNAAPASNSIRHHRLQVSGP